LSGLTTFPGKLHQFLYKRVIGFLSHDFYRRHRTSVAAMSLRSSIFSLERAAGLVSRFHRCERGATALEFIAVAPILMVILLATLEISMIYFAQSNLEYITEEGMRLVLTNQANSLTQTQFNSAICSKVIALFNCSNLIISLQTAPTSVSGISAALPQFDTTGKLVSSSVQFSIPQPSAGTQEPIMMLVVMYQWPVISGPLGFNFGNLANGNYLLASTQVFQIEPQS
jgi:hypothetical protein